VVTPLFLRSDPRPTTRRRLKACAIARPMRCAIRWLPNRCPGDPTWILLAQKRTSTRYNCDGSCFYFTIADVMRDLPGITSFPSRPRLKGVRQPFAARVGAFGLRVRAKTSLARTNAPHEIRTLGAHYTPGRPVAQARRCVHTAKLFVEDPLGNDKTSGQKTWVAYSRFGGSQELYGKEERRLQHASTLLLDGIVGGGRKVLRNNELDASTDSLTL